MPCTRYLHRCCTALALCPETVIMKSTALFTAVLVASAAFAASNDTGRYLVTHKGDTIQLHRKAYLQFDRHPQAICNWNEKGKKYLIVADTVSLLRMDASSSWFDYAKGVNSFTSFGIATKTGHCMHFGKVLLRQGETAMYVTPHCYRCSKLTIYYRTGNGLGHAITKQNFREVLTNHFHASPSLIAYSKRKRYNAYALMKLLQ